VLAQSSPTYGVGRTPTAEELRALDISIGPDGVELPAGRGTAKEARSSLRVRGARHAMGRTGPEAGLRVEIEGRTQCRHVGTGRILPVRAPFATTVWDYINRAMPSR